MSEGSKAGKEFKSLHVLRWQCGFSGVSLWGEMIDDWDYLDLMMKFCSSDWVRRFNSRNSKELTQS